MAYETIPQDGITDAVIDAETLRADTAAIRSLLVSGHTGAALTMFDVKRRDFMAWDTMQQVQAFAAPTSGAPRLDADTVQNLRAFWAQQCLDLKHMVMTAHREAASTHLGAQVLKLWELDTRVNCAETIALQAEEARLAKRHAELAAGGEGAQAQNSSNQSDIEDAADARTAPRDAEGGDVVPARAALYTQQVQLRQTISVAAGFSDFQTYAYARLQRVDYGPNDVARFRDSVRKHVVPLLTACVQRQIFERAGSLGDAHNAQEDAIRPAGGPRLLYDRMTGILTNGGEDQELGSFYKALQDQQFVQLDQQSEARASVTVLPLPVKGQAAFMRINCIGAADDIALMAQGFGRAYQFRQGGALAQIDYLLPTDEAARIPPKALSLIMMSRARKLLNEGAAPAYRQMQLRRALTSLVRNACLDAFEHEVYAHPDWSFTQQEAAWTDLCRIFFPWREDYGDNGDTILNWYDHAILFDAPFTAINEALSMCCALQIWLSSRIDANDATELFKSICGLGGVHPFQTLIEKSGLLSPFGPDALPEIMHEIEPLLWS